MALRRLAGVAMPLLAAAVGIGGSVMESPWAALPRAVSADDMTAVLQELENIAVLGGFSPTEPSRSVRTRGHNMTADYIQELLESRTDYTVTQQWFLAKGDRLGNEEHWVSNVLVRTGRGDPARRVMLGAHLDSVDEGPGLNDNGSGVAGLLELALRYHELGLGEFARNELVFGFWGGEEFGLLGSKHYVEAAAQSGELADLALSINLDMIASWNYAQMIYSPNAFGSPIPDEILEPSRRIGTRVPAKTMLLFCVCAIVCLCLSRACLGKYSLF
jgi:hypothetical protein